MNILLFHLHKAPQKVKFRDRKYNGGCQKLGGGENGSWCLMGTEFQFGKMRRVLEMDSDGCTSM